MATPVSENDSSVSNTTENHDPEGVSKAFYFFVGALALSLLVLLGTLLFL